MFKIVMSSAATVMLVAGCGEGVKPEVPSPSAGAVKPDTSSITIEGDSSEAVNKLAIEAIADLQTYWSEEFPKLYGQDYKPVEGGLYALTPDSESGPACADDYGDVEGNAFYCKLDDSVAWDAAGLLPDLQKTCRRSTATSSSPSFSRTSGATPCSSDRASSTRTN